MKHDPQHLTGQPYWHPTVHPDAGHGRHTLSVNWATRLKDFTVDADLNPHWSGSFRVNVHGGAFR
jgi:hypothetical protein